MVRLKEYFKKYKPLIDKELENFFEELERPEDEFNRIMFQEIRNFVMAGGKRARPGLVLVGYQAVTRKEPEEKVIKASIALELLHAYLLIHDDIMDRDEVRRNAPTVWKAFYDRYGDYHYAISLAILAGDFTEAFSQIALRRAGLDVETEKKIIDRIHDVIVSTGMGQTLDVSLAYTPLEKVRKEDILKVYEYKTAIYTIVNPMEVGVLIGGGKKNIFYDYGIPVGIAFQIKDDILGVFGSSEVTGKPNDSDIKEGKRTLLVWYAYNNGSEEDKRVLERVLGNRDASEEDVQAVRDIFVSTGAKDWAEEYALELSEKGKEEAEKLDIDAYIRDLLYEFAEFVVKREK